jgi:lipopolysaccharide biosynthesis glycosyltransferase
MLNKGAAKRPLAILAGVTGDLAFAAGCLLLSLRRHSPALQADIILYTDADLPAKDAQILRGLGAVPTLFSPPEGGLSREALRQFSPLSLARFEGFLLLKRYKAVLWLDVDTAVQDDISGLAAYGPFGLALEDPHFTEAGQTSASGINVHTAMLPVDGLNPDEPNLNSGVLVLRDELRDPEALYALYRQWFKKYAPALKYPDQAVLNMLAQHLRREDPASFALIPHDLYNAHPRNPKAQTAAIVHAFGAYKLWDDGLTSCSFPEWRRDYARWLGLGGTPWKGKIENSAYLEGGAFFMLRRLFESTLSAQAHLERLRKEWLREKAAREKLEKLLARISR